MSSVRPKRLQAVLRPLRDRVVDHRIYQQIDTMDDLRSFMEHHVFAVWDFMCLLKALQQHLTCVAIPWLPRGDALSRRLINEIVLEEESGESQRGCYLSHFELYRAAMQSCGADLSRIDAFVDQLRRGVAVPRALELAHVPDAARRFVESSWAVASSCPPHSIAAAFTFGREELIPDMFKTLVGELGTQFPGRLDLLQDYLQRHIRLDGDRHGPMALRLLAELCGDDPQKWSEAEEAARTALGDRVALWDAVAEALVPGPARMSPIEQPPRSAAH